MERLQGSVILKMSEMHSKSGGGCSWQDLVHLVELLELMTVYL